jgi:hypothetical protein
MFRKMVKQKTVCVAEIGESRRESEANPILGNRQMFEGTQ